MKASDIVSYLFDAFPYRRKSTADWVLPATIGLGVGVMAGVGIGVLIAPESGDITRQRIRLGAERVKERAKVAANKAADSLSEGARHLSEGGRQTSGVDRSFVSNDFGGGR
jgi:gas vesicle protein